MSAERGQAGGDDRANDQAARARLERAAHFLDPEDDSGQRRVEGRRHARRRSRQQKPALPIGRDAADGEHDRRADLHGRTFAPVDAPHSRPNVITTILPKATRSETSGARSAWSSICSAAMACGMPLPCEFGKNMPRQQGRDRKAQWRRREGDERRALKQSRESFLRMIRQPGHRDGDRADRNSADDEKAPARPALEGQTRPHGDMRQRAIEIFRPCHAASLPNPHSAFTALFSQLFPIIQPLQDFALEAAFDRPVKLLSPSCSGQ